MFDIPNNLKYTKNHVWLENIGEDAYRVGITDFAQDELGDIVFVEMPNIGDQFNQDDTVGTIEAVKTVADIFSPIKGIVTEINNDIEDKPELVNSDPYSKGWLVKMRFEDQDDSVSGLLTSQEYNDIIS